MPRYEVRPLECGNLQRGFPAIDGGAILQITSQIGCDEADVFFDGNYAYSLRLNGRAGFWTIFQRRVEPVAVRPSVRRSRRARARAAVKAGTISLMSPAWWTSRRAVAAYTLRRAGCC